MQTERRKRGRTFRGCQNCPVKEKREDVLIKQQRVGHLEEGRVCQVSTTERVCGR